MVLYKGRRGKYGTPSLTRVVAASLPRDNGPTDPRPGGNIYLESATKVARVQIKTSSKHITKNQLNYMNDLKTRINNGIKFFRGYIHPNKYGGASFEKWLPTFINLVDQYVNEDETFKQGKEIFK